MTPVEWKERIGDAVAARRVELGLTSRYDAARRAEELGHEASETTWRQIETGERRIEGGEVQAPNPRMKTQRAIAAVLRWDNNWLLNLLAGRQPVAMLGPITRSTEDYNATIPSLAPEYQAAIDAIIATAKAKEGE